MPAVIVTTPKPAPPHSLGMTWIDFTKDVVTVHRGDRITFVNSSGNIHAIGPGEHGRISSPVPGEPLTGFNMLETNASYTTGPWRVPGTYHVTCSVHAMMDVTIVVLP